jgi:preprotein translocase SecE subunit
VARQRQRARDRKQRAREQASDPAQPGPRPDALNRSDVPASVQHIGAEDEFEAAIVSGAEGDAADDGLGADVSEEEIERQALEAAPEPEEEPSRREGALEARRAGGVTTGGGNRFINFLRASWAELQRVQWPDRRQVAQATGVVIGFVIIAGLYLGLADWVAQKVVNYII